MLQGKVAGKIKTHFILDFFSENRAVYEIMWKNIDRGRQATDDNIIRPMRFSCCVVKATNTQSE